MLEMARMLLLRFVTMVLSTLTQILVIHMSISRHNLGPPALYLEVSLRFVYDKIRIERHTGDGKILTSFFKHI